MQKTKVAVVVVDACIILYKETETVSLRNAVALIYIIYIYIYIIYYIMHININTPHTYIHKLTYSY
jgi:hypothetical protein